MLFWQNKAFGATLWGFPRREIADVSREELFFYWTGNSSHTKIKVNLMLACALEDK